MVFYVILQASGELLRKHQKYQVLTAAPLIDYPQSVSQPANIFNDGAQLNNLFSFTPLTHIFPQHPHDFGYYYHSYLTYGEIRTSEVKTFY